MNYSMEKRYVLQYGDTKLYFFDKQEALYQKDNLCSHGMVYEIECLKSQLFSGRDYYLYIVNLYVSNKEVQLYVEGNYGDIFVIIDQYMNNNEYQYQSIYEYLYVDNDISYYKNRRVDFDYIHYYEKDIPNQFALSMLDYLNDNNSDVISILIEDIDNYIFDEQSLLENETLRNRGLDGYLYDYHCDDNHISMTSEGIKKKCYYLLNYLYNEAMNLSFNDMMMIYIIQDKLRESKDIEELLYWTAKMHYWGGYDVAYPYTYYMMVKEGKFDSLRLVCNDIYL